ncbi:MAG: hypothetical protein OXC81_05555 [Betaproteobacteria bacterium]|nr:hypothetical protein [Betaproteobacteria bacterium]
MHQVGGDHPGTDCQKRPQKCYKQFLAPNRKTANSAAGQQQQQQHMEDDFFLTGLALQIEEMANGCYHQPRHADPHKPGSEACRFSGENEAPAIGPGSEDTHHLSQL